MDANVKTQLHSPETRLDIEREMLHIQQLGMHYAIHVPTGASFIFMGDFKFPDAKGVRFPKEWAVARFWLWVHKRFNAIMIAGLVAVAFVVLQLGLAITYPGDMWAHVIAIFSYWMNASLIVLSCLSIMAWSVRHFYKSGVQIEFGGDNPKALPSGEVSIAPDVLIMTMPGEDPASFDLRIQDAIEATEGTQKWVLAIAKGQPTFAVLENSENISATGSMRMTQDVFLRSKAFITIQEGDGEWEQELNRSFHQFKNETEIQFHEYCKNLATDFRRWAQFKKLGKTNHFQTLVDSAKSAAVILTLIFVPMLLQAQKESQVRAYLGDRSELLKPEAGQLVSFIWERREIEVRADGSSNPIELLKGTPFYTDANKEGKLLSIKIGGEQVLPKSPTVAQGAVSKQDERIPVLPSPAADGKSVLESLPDSNTAEAAKAEIMRNRAHDWVKVRPWVELQMWKFYQILGVVLILLAFLLWVAWVSSADALDDIHGYPFIGGFLMGCYVYSKAISAGVIFAIGAVFAIEHAITYWYTGQPITFEFLLKIGILPVLWYFVAKKLLPNIKRNAVTQSGGYQSPFQDNNQRRLN